MPKYLLLLLTILNLSFALNAQSSDIKSPNYKSIKKEIAKKNSMFYYPKLMEKYLNGDSTMSIEEKRHLYYGYIFHKNYTPYGISLYTDSIAPLLEKEKLSDKELKQLDYYCNLILHDNPFDIRVLSYQMFVYEQQNRKDLLEKKINQANIILDALFSSGDGLSKETAYYVIYVSHEYDIINILGFEFGGEQKLIEHYDYLSLAKNQYKIKGLYFDISPSLNSLNDIFNN